MAKIKKETVDALSRKPILTTDMSKVKSYQDSLYAYNLSQQMKNLYSKGIIRSSDFDESTYKKSLDDFYNKYVRSGVYNEKVLPYAVKKNGSYTYDWINYTDNNKSGILKVNKPIQPYVYGFERQELNPISPIGLKKTDFESEELSPIELKNKKVSLKEPEHWLDITEPNGKGTQRMYFDSKEEKEAFMKENPMLRIGQNSVAKIRPETLEYLKNKK